jgi:DNA (cytosine-5)-methyltransferase 1
VYYVGDKTKEFSRLSRFGMTLQPLTADRGEALLKSFLAAFLAKTFQQPEEAQESTENVQDSGVRWRELSVKYDQDLSSWRTHQCLFQEVLEESSLTLPRWGLMRNGELSERTRPEHLTSEIEFGCWPTPVSSDHKNRGPNSKQQGLSEWVRMWPTPSANQYETKDLDKMLERRARCKESSGNGNGFGLTLANAVQIEERKTWATPRTSDYKSCGPVGSKSHHHMTEKQYLCAQVKKEDQPTGHLNPTWVEWLMGWPIGWTDSKPLETDRFQQWWNSHGKHSEAFD